MAGPGWQEYFRDKGEPWDDYRSAEAFRQRHLEGGFMAMIKALSRRR